MDSVHIHAAESSSSTTCTPLLGQGLQGHTQTPVSNGTHLVVGGRRGPTQPLDQAVLIIPSTTGAEIHMCCEVSEIPARWRHTAVYLSNPDRGCESNVYVSDRVLVYGGRDANRVYGDVWVLDVVYGASASIQCTRLIDTSAKTRITCPEPNSSSSEMRKSCLLPPPRHSHAAACLSDGRSMVVVGGLTEDEVVLDDVWLLEPHTSTWSQVSVTGFEAR